MKVKKYLVGLVVVVLVTFLGVFLWIKNRMGVIDKRSESVNYAQSVSNSEDKEIKAEGQKGELVDKSDWKTYVNLVHSYSFKYPRLQDFEIVENGGIDNREPGLFGTYLIKKPAYNSPAFTVHVEHVTRLEIFSNTFGSAEVLEKAAERGTEEIAKISRQVNLQQEKNSPDKRVGEIESFGFDGGTAYGFTVTDILNTCLTTDHYCDSGRVLEEPMIIVFVTDGKDVYEVEFPVGTQLGRQILSTFRFKG